MIEILGNDISLAISENGIEAKNTYRSGVDELHVWELDDANYKKLSAISKDDWKSSYGWWREASCMYEGSADKTYIVNELPMKGYTNEDHPHYYGDSYKSFKLWLSETFDLGTEKNVTAFSTSLARDNGLSLSEFMRRYQP